MSRIETQTVTLKNGQSVLLRSVEVSEAARLLAAMIETAETSPYILSTADAFRKMTVEDEEKFIQKHNDDPRTLLIVAEAQGRFVGITNLACFKDPKRYHRAMLGLSIVSEYRGLGLGEAMMKVLVQTSLQMPGLERIELSVMAENVPAYRLYQKLGFLEYARHPQAFRLLDGTVQDEIFMVYRP